MTADGPRRNDPHAGSPGASGNPLAGSNLPFTLVILVCAAALIWFLILVKPFSGDGGSATPPVDTGNGATEDSTSTTDVTNGTNGEPGSDTTEATAPPITGEFTGIRLEIVTTQVQFPVFATGREGDDRIFVLERSGAVLAIAPDGSSSIYLDLTDRVDSAGIENGLLGMAFHPDFDTNGRLFINYTTAPSDSPDSRISEFTASSATAATVDRNTENILIEIQQRGIRHRAGMLMFGPDDGLLYAALGDGGMGDRSSQEHDTLHGTILRLDVDRQDPGLEYAIPPGNPFADGDGRSEIWSWGLRNPWRFTIDPVDDLIYIGDVGQGDWEEINIRPLGEAGLNYEWPDFEGDMCYLPIDGCDMERAARPQHLVGHTEDDAGCSITAGHVYRGSAIPELWGHFFYGDWCHGWIRSFVYQNGQVTDHRDWMTDMQASFDTMDNVNYIRVGSFGIDADGELLVVDTDGVIFRMVRNG